MKAGRRFLRSAPRPERFVLPVSTAVLLLLAWAAVAHASGSGWVQAIGAIAAGVVFVGMVGPAAAAARLQVKCVACPRDAGAGEPFAIEIVSNVPLRCTPDRPRGEAVIVPWDTSVKVTVTPPTRGVIHTVRVRLATAAPLGLLWWSVERSVVLPVSIEVAPAFTEGWIPATVGATDDEGHGRAVPSWSGDLRGVRLYAHGDSPRLVHWRATAHTGTLMIRENEQEPDMPLKITAELSGDGEEAETAAGDALRTIATLLAGGKRVVLETWENGSRTAAQVVDRRGAGRRLARAGQNPYGDLDPAATGACK